ncbi:hypothetical protein [Halobacteriovorax sp. DPLXC-1]|uniref:hypothetical protein n=1 Tax=Halobacteriovorax sp. DPLXC-1 TaxID=3110771 RepID=UPI002FF0B7F9
MSYFDLCNEYKKSRELFFKTHDDATEFATTVFNGFRSYLGLDENEYDLIKLVPTIQFEPEEEEEYFSPIDEDISYTPHGAVKLADNGYWIFSILLRLHIDGNKNMQPAENIKFDISYKKVKDTIYFKYVQDNQDMQIQIGELESYLKKNVYSNMEKTIMEFYQSQVKFFLHDRSVERKIGLIA